MMKTDKLIPGNVKTEQLKSIEEHIDDLAELLIQVIEQGASIATIFYYKSMLEEKLRNIMSTHPTLMRDLELVKCLNLPNWCIAAGYVRNFVWDYLHQYAERTPMNDVDVLYYDLTDTNEDTEKHYQNLLKLKLQGYNWSVKNQARMHDRNKEEPYLSVEDAMKRWPETATAIGITLDEDNKLRILSPHGLEDLFELIIRRSPYFMDDNYYQQRVKNKDWLNTWPKLKSY
jgi:hypothetical protein